MQIERSRASREINRAIYRPLISRDYFYGRIYGARSSKTYCSLLREMIVSRLSHFSIFRRYHLLPILLIIIIAFSYVDVENLTPNQRSHACIANNVIANTLNFGFGFRLRYPRMSNNAYRVV
jgi:hypothetical protein